MTSRGAVGLLREPGWEAIEGEDEEARLVLHRRRQMIKTRSGDEREAEKEAALGGWGGLVPLHDTRGSETQRSGTAGTEGRNPGTPGLVWLQGVGIKEAESGDLGVFSKNKTSYQSIVDRVRAGIIISPSLSPISLSLSPTPSLSQPAPSSPLA